MGVPFEALLPYAIMTGMFCATAVGMSKIRHMQNGGKRGRHSIDQWDRRNMRNRLLIVQLAKYALRIVEEDKLKKYETLTYSVMDRDRRLTGMLRGQTDNHLAPKGFELNNPWRLEPRIS